MGGFNNSITTGACIYKIAFGDLVDGGIQQQHHNRPSARFFVALACASKLAMPAQQKTPPTCRRGCDAVVVGAARFELATSCSQSRRDNRATLRPELCIHLPGAVREGFEPSVQFNPYDGLANRSFRPLRHLTNLPSLFEGTQK